MAVGTVSYNFTSSNLLPSSATAGWSGTAPVKTGTGTMSWFEITAGTSGRLEYVPAQTGATQTTNYIAVTFGPDDPDTVWTPGVISFQARSFVTGTHALRVRNSFNSYGTTNQFATGALSSTTMTTYSFDLSSLGQRTGKMTLRFYGQAATSTAKIGLDNFSFSGDALPPTQTIIPGVLGSAEAFGVPEVSFPTVDQDVAPASFGGETFGTGTSVEVAPEQALSPASFGGEVVGAPVVVAIQPVNLSPDSIISGEAFGPPVVVVVQPLTISPASFGGEAFGPPGVVVVDPLTITPDSFGGEVFGSPDVVNADQGILGAGGIASGEVVPGVVVERGVPVAPYPTGEDVVEFLGATNEGELVAVATVHVGVITHFARIYCRGNGFYVDGVDPEIGSVILAATARLVSNPEQIDITVGSVRRSGSFKGWTLAEQKVLNPYRKVAQ